MFKSLLLTLFICGSTVAAQASEVEIQRYELTERHADKIITFENLSISTNKQMDRLKVTGAQFSIGFKGQYSGNGMTGDTADSGLAPKTKFRKYSKADLILSSIQGAGTALSTASVAHARVNSGDWQDYALFGRAPISLRFDEDQFAVGLRIWPMSLGKQRKLPTGQSGPEYVFLKAFRRDGSLIGELTFLLPNPLQFSLIRCQRTQDIAGIQLLSSVKAGIAIDDIAFDLPIEKASDLESGLHMGDATEYGLPDTNISPCVGLFS